MVRRALGRGVRLALTAAVAASIALGHGQNAPFRDVPLAVSAAFGAERALARVTALGTQAGPPAAEAVRETVAAASNEDLPLFLVSLQHTNAALASTLVQALGALQATAGPAAGQVAHVHALARRAARALTADLPDDTARAADLALVLTGPGGLSDTFSQAVDQGDRLGLATAWALLQRSHALWQSLQSRASAPQRQAVDAALARIDAIVPAPASPAHPGPGAADELENDANQVVVTLGAALHTSLVPDSDLAGLTATIASLARIGCAADVAASKQQLAVSSMLYAAYLSPSAAMLAPASDGAAQKAYTSLAEGSRSRSGTCKALMAALGRVAAALGG